MPVELRIRPALETDTDLILEFVRALAEYERLEHQVTADAALVRKHLFEEHYAEAVIAEAGSTPVGFALFFHTFSTFLGRPGIYLEDLFVNPEHRGCGYGKALLLHVAALAVERGCGRMEWSVLNWNEPSIRFYESLGALPQKEWTIYRLTGDALRRHARA